MSGRRGVVATAALTLASLFALLGGVALAYFSGGGSGSAQAGVSQIDPPQLTKASAAASTVELAWTGVAAPGEGTVRYFVTRDGGDAAGNCSTEANPAANLSCTDTGVAPGKHIYEVTAVWRSWTATGEPETVTSTIGAASRFTIAASTTTPTAGAQVNLTITARDAGGSVVSSYAGNKTLVFAGASASPDGTKPTVVNRSGSAISFGSNTSLTFSSGVSSVTSNRNGVLRLYRAGPAEIQATQGSITTPQPLTLTVEPESAADFALAAASATPTAGSGNELTITALDTYGNTATSYAGAKNLTFSGPPASPAGDVATVTNSSGKAVNLGNVTAIEFAAGVATPAAGANGTLTAYGSGAASVSATQGSIATASSASITVAAAEAAKLALSASATSFAATSSTNLTTTAQDAYGNTATSYAGSRSLVFSGASASPSGTSPTVVNSSGSAIGFGGATPLTFTNGVAAVSSGRNGLTRLPRAAAAGVSATDGTISTPNPLAFSVSPGTVSRVAFDGLSASGGTVGSPCLFTCPVTSLGNKGKITSGVALTDSLGNTVSGIGSTKTVTVKVSSGGTITGSPLTVPATGLAVSAADFVYTAPSSGNFSHTITAASSGYTSATSAVSR